MDRNNAIKLVSENILQKLTNEERYSDLLNWWAIGPDDEEYTNLPEALKKEMLN